MKAFSSERTPVPPRRPRSLAAGRGRRRGFSTLTGDLGYLAARVGVSRTVSDPAASVVPCATMITEFLQLISCRISMKSEILYDRAAPWARALRVSPRSHHAPLN